MEPNTLYSIIQETKSQKLCIHDNCIPIIYHLFQLLICSPSSHLTIITLAEASKETWLVLQVHFPLPMIGARSQQM